VKRAYVGNIPFDTTESDLRLLFLHPRCPLTLTKVEIVYNLTTGKPRGFAFVEFESEAALDEAIRQYNGSKLGGRVILINDATEKKGRGA